MQRVYNSEGFADSITATIPNYKYYRRDHLGNNRELWVANTKKTIQRTQYYPSGLPWASNTGDNPGTQERKYNGKEIVEMHGYDTYDYGARGYYPALGRFSSVDPLAEMYYSVSPYVYCKDNPVNYIDPNGEFRTHFLAWIHKVTHGGGSKIQQNGNGQYYYTKDLKNEPGVSAVYGSNGVKGKPDQNSGIPFVVNGGAGGGFGSDTKAKHVENPVNITLFMFPFGGTSNATTGQFVYDLAAKIAALATANVSDQNSTGEEKGEGDEWELSEITYNSVLGDDDPEKNKGGYHRHSGDTTYRVLHYFNKKKLKFKNKKRNICTN